MWPRPHPRATPLRIGAGDVTAAAQHVAPGAIDEEQRCHKEPFRAFNLRVFYPRKVYELKGLRVQGGRVDFR